MTATWKLIETDVRLSCHLPTKASFIANLYECTNCLNIANDRTGLLEVCPWCKAEMITTKGEKNNLIPLFLYLTKRYGAPIVINVNNIVSIEPTDGDDNDYTIITISGDENDNWYVVREPFAKIIETIQAASVEQYDKLSQTVVIKNK